MDDKDIIYTIHAYELSIELPENERITFTDEYGIAHLHGGDSHAQNLAGYADKCIDYLAFGDEVDEASVGAFPPYEQIKITPEKIVYYNEKQGQKLERLVGIQFPDYYSSIAPNTIIKLPCCINNPKTPVQKGLSVHMTCSHPPCSFAAVSGGFSLKAKR